MKQFLLAIVTVMLFARAGLAETVAGQEVNVPVPAPVPLPPLVVDAAQTVGPETVTRVVRDVQRIVRRLKGRMLGSIIQQGMTMEQVDQIVGCSPSKSFFDGGLVRQVTDEYSDDLGLCVTYSQAWTAAGEALLKVVSVSHPPIIE